MEITHFGYVSFGLNNQPAAVRFRRFQRVYMTDIDQVIFEHDSTLSMLTKAVLLTHEAPRRPRIGHEPHSLTRMGRQGRFRDRPVESSSLTDRTLRLRPGALGWSDRQPKLPAVPYDSTP